MATLAALGPAAQAQEQSEPEKDAIAYGMVQYPLEGNYTAVAGTIELWIKPHVAPDGPMEDYYQFFIFRLSWGEEISGDDGMFSVVWKSEIGLQAFDDAQGPRLKNLPSPRRGAVAWKQGQWHHFAFTWNGPEMTIYCDGERVAQTRASGTLPAAGPGHIFLGFGNSEVSIDDFAISSIARTPEAIAQRMQAPLAMDEYTLILDPFDAMDGPEARTIHARSRTELVPGRHGQGLRLFTAGQ